MTILLRAQLKSIREYNWHGQNIKIQTHSSAKFLWLDNKLDVLINSKKVKHFKSSSFTQSSTKFSISMQDYNLKGQIISKGIPFIPIRSQSIIIDDTILEKNRLFASKQLLSYTFLSAIILGFQSL